MWITKNGVVIEDSQKTAFEITKKIYTICQEDDEAFKRFLITSQNATEEVAEQLLEVFKKMKEFV